MEVMLYWQCTFDNKIVWHSFILLASTNYENETPVTAYGGKHSRLVNDGLNKESILFINNVLCSSLQLTILNSIFSNLFVQPLPLSAYPPTSTRAEVPRTLYLSK